MSRIKNFARGVVSSYIALAFNILYTMASVPLVLSYLSAKEFGLWALISQVGNFFLLLDLGLASAVSRNLIDYKDRREDGSYGALIKTAAIVSTLQGMAIIAFGWALSPFLGGLFALSPEFQDEFRFLFLAYIIIAGLSFIPRPFLASLYANQRQDITNWAASGQLVISFASLWVGLEMGMGLSSMILASALGTIWFLGAQAFMVHRLRLLPQGGEWGRPRWGLFWELFRYAKEVFLMGLGVQLILASPVFIITRLLGLDAVAVWSICSKVFILIQQFVGKIADLSQVVLAEMYVRKETERLLLRFREIVGLTASVSALASLLGIFGNQDFVSLWTGGEIRWAPVNNVLLGLYVFIHSVTRCYASIVGVTKEIRFARYIYFIEALVFIALAIVAGGRYGLTGILVSYLVADLIPSLYGIYRSHEFFNVPYREMVFQWVKPSLLFVLLFTPLALAIAWATHSLPLLERFFLQSAVFGLVGINILWYFGLLKENKMELKRGFAKIGLTKK